MKRAFVTSRAGASGCVLNQLTRRALRDLFWQARHLPSFEWLHLLPPCSALTKEKRKISKIENEKKKQRKRRLPSWTSSSFQIFCKDLNFCSLSGCLETVGFASSPSTSESLLSPAAKFCVRTNNPKINKGILGLAGVGAFAGLPEWAYKKSSINVRRSLQFSTAQNMKPNMEERPYVSHRFMMAWSNSSCWRGRRGSASFCIIGPTMNFWRGAHWCSS